MARVRHLIAMGCLLWAVPAAQSARAQLRVDVTQGVVDPIPIAVVPFAAAADPALILPGSYNMTWKAPGAFVPWYAPR